MISARRVEARLIWVGAVAMVLLLAGLSWVAMRPAGERSVELMSVRTITAPAVPATKLANPTIQDKVQIGTDALSPPVRVSVEPTVEEPRQASPAPPSAAAGPSFDGRTIRKQRTMEMIVTGYSPDERSCGKWADGITASGYSVWTNGMKLVAADTRVLPMKSVISIPGYNAGKPVPVLDRGGAIKGNRLDLLFPTHEQARQWGRKKVTITVWEYAD
jgi:3D (Asp-Asp-Asp) domain-containing protein